MEKLRSRGDSGHLASQCRARVGAPPAPAVRGEGMGWSRTVEGTRHSRGMGRRGNQLILPLRVREPNRMDSGRGRCFYWLSIHPHGWSGSVRVCSSLNLT